MIKPFAKRLITNILWRQVVYLQKKHKIKVIGVVGSVGKTTTKYAVAQILQSKYKVRWQEGNYNDITIVPLVFFGQNIPSLVNPFAWLNIFINNHRQIKNYPYEFVVLELGTDGPGQIKEFGKYIKLDLAIVTAVAPEHMEFFKTLDAVAKEEFSVASYSNHILVNKDLVDQKHITVNNSKLLTYGSKQADYIFKNDPKLSVSKNNKHWLTARRVLSKEIAFSKVAAAIVADYYDFETKEITDQLDVIKGAPGRLQILNGINNSIIIDDTYNASPNAVIAALSILYNYKLKNKIAILGSMNELGEYSKTAHEQVGYFCDPKQISLLVIVGNEAKKYLTPVARDRGCKIVEFDNPYDAGEFVKNHIKSSSVILIKGSQNNVYLEEAVKILLADDKDLHKLVRQTDDWHKKRKKNFKM